MPIDAPKLKKLLDRAKEQKKDFVEAAEESRRVYGGRLSYFMSSSPDASWNFHRIATQNILSRLITTKPIPYVGAKNEELVEVAKIIEKKLDSKLQQSNSMGILKKALLDTIICGNGFVYVNTDGLMEYLNYFDVYVDNALTIDTSNNIETGRYLFIRRLYDQEDFKVRFPKYKNTKLTGPLDDLPGREFVGTSIKGGNYKFFEQSTAAFYKSNPTQTKINDAQMDGLVEVWECFVLDEDSPSGWSQCFMYNDEIVSEWTQIPEKIGSPPVINFPYDSISGQFYQPNQWCYIAGKQQAVDYLAERVLYISSLIPSPPLLVQKQKSTTNKSNKVYDFYPRSIIELEAGEREPTLMVLPPVDASILKLRDGIKEDMRAELGVHEVSEGQVSQQLSGVAIQALAQQTNVRTALLFTSVEEGLKDLAKMMAIVCYLDEPQIVDDFSFSFQVGLPLSREQKLAQIMESFPGGITSLVTMPPELAKTALKLVGVIMQDSDIMEGLVQVLDEIQPQPQIPELQPQIPQPPLTPELEEEVYPEIPIEQMTLDQMLGRT